jgi:hypothetical protein
MHNSIQKIKYLEINLTKEVKDLYTEGYETAKWYKEMKTSHDQFHPYQNSNGLF